MLHVRNTLLLTHGVFKMVSIVCREVDEVREERLGRRRECDRRTYVEERETNEERRARL